MGELPPAVWRKVRGIRRRYVLARRAERLLGRAHASLANDALRVVLEWGPPARLSEGWRLRQRQPDTSPTVIGDALTAAHAVCHEAYKLTAEAWPQDRREVASEVDRAAAKALQALTTRYPDLEGGLLRRVVSQANYTHAR